MINLIKSLGKGIITHRKPLIQLFLIGAGIIIFANVTFFFLSPNPTSCTLCHYMQPYYDNWKTSSHKEVPCIKCHPYRMRFLYSSLPRYIAKSYVPRPRTEIEDRVCMQSGCHSERILKGKVKFKGSIIFDHKDHLGKLRRGLELRCTSCHSQIVQGEHMAVTEKVCYICHFKGAVEGQSATGCPSCHGTPTRVVEHEGFSLSHESYLNLGVACNQCHVNIAEGTGDVPKERCFTCHVERMEEYGHLKFLHDKHVKEHKVDCLSCHTEIKHGNIQMTEPLEVTCEKCHRKSHSPQKEMYMGTSGKGVRDIPSRMFAAQVSCDGCHTSGDYTKAVGTLSTEGKSIEVEKKACVTCHGKGYDLMLEDWKKVIDNEVQNFAPVLQTAEETIQKSGKSGNALSKAKDLIKDARFNYTFVKEGKGVHNVEYAVRLFKAAADQTDNAMKLLNKDAKPIVRDALIGTPDNYCMTLCHARLGIPKKIIFDDMPIDFTHEVHAKNLGIRCTRCHSPEKHKMRIIEKEGCMNCHHKQRDIECVHCHQDQKLFQQGTAGGYGVFPMERILKEMPDAMAERVACKDCHDLTQKDHSIAAIKNKCVGCHGKGYDDKIIQWEKDLLNAQNNLTLKLTESKGKMIQAQKDRKDTRRAEELYHEAETNLRLVERANGVHNLKYAKILLEQAMVRSNQIQDILKK